MSQPLNLKNTAARIGCSVDHVRRLVERGEIKAVNIGLGTVRRRLVVFPNEIEAYLARQSTGIPTKPRMRSTPVSRKMGQWV